MSAVYRWLLGFRVPVLSQYLQEPSKEDPKRKSLVGGIRAHEETGSRQVQGQEATT